MISYQSLLLSTTVLSNLIINICCKISVVQETKRTTKIKDFPSKIKELFAHAMYYRVRIIRGVEIYGIV